jgi:hypothetical protein
MVCHQLDESIEQVGHVVRAGAGLGVALEAECRRVGAGDALQRAVEQRDVGAAQGRRQGRRIDSEAVVLASDGDTPLSRSLTGWLAPWWPNFIFTVLAPEASASS